MKVVSFSRIGSRLFYGSPGGKNSDIVIGANNVIVKDGGRWEQLQVDSEILC